MNEELIIAYLAGLMDGEGSWSIQIQEGRSPNPRMTMTLRYGAERPLSLLVDHFGGNIYQSKDDMMRWSLGGVEKMKLATYKLLPYLTIKRQIAENFIAALNMWPSKKGVNFSAGERSWTPELRSKVVLIAKTLNAH